MPSIDTLSLLTAVLAPSPSTTGGVVLDVRLAFAAAFATFVAVRLAAQDRKVAAGQAAGVFWIVLVSRGH
ncbi:hypothetical protein SAMN04489713_1288 [Actinomadura madurae]|uniref:Uncharacterized protein n=1 Tax=Actinomadura madurae TaxID=1993 RepID=A0A1I5XRG5_9ACTN|nr:hypothetical protein [Actinomadura madurae]SFQ34533.1 hypothetical protein SAMN04489713_1288 [Actinomadura madurae]